MLSYSVLVRCVLSIQNRQYVFVFFEILDNQRLHEGSSYLSDFFKFFYNCGYLKKNKIYIHSAQWFLDSVFLYIYRDGGGGQILDIEVLYLTEVLLPLNDERLDFVMGDWDRELKGNIQVYNKVTNRLEEHRRAHLNGQQELQVFTILLKPSLLGMVDSKIRLTFQEEGGKIHMIEYPIIGLVASSSSVMVDTKDNNLRGLMRSYSMRS